MLSPRCREQSDGDRRVHRRSADARRPCLAGKKAHHLILLRRHLRPRPLGTTTTTRQRGAGTPKRRPLESRLHSHPSRTPANPCVNAATDTCGRARADMQVLLLDVRRELHPRRKRRGERVVAKKNMLGTASAWKDAMHIFRIGAAFRV